MTLKLAVRIEADASGLKPATEDATRQLQGVGAAAEQAAAQVERALGGDGRPRAPDGRFLPSGQPALSPAGGKPPAQGQPPAQGVPPAPNVIPFPTATQVAGGLSPEYRRMLMRDLAFQGKDFFEQVISGSSLFRAGLTQAPQAATIMSMGGFSVGDVFKSATEGAGSLLAKLGPLGIAFGGLAAGAGLATLVLNRATDQANEVRRALRVGAGLRSGMAAGDIEALSHAPGLSRSEGRASALAYGGAGASRANTAAALGLTHGLADLMYEGDVRGAQKALSDAMRGGTASLLKYVDAIRPLSPATSDWIERIRATQGEQAANAELLKLLNEGIKAAGLETPLWSQALRGLGNAASDLADAFLREAANRANSTVREVQALTQGRNDIGGNTAREVDAIRRLLAGLVPDWGAPREDPRQRPPVDESRYGRPLPALPRSVQVPLPPDASGAIASSLADLSADGARGIAGAKEVRGLNRSYDTDAEALRRLNDELAAYDRLLKDLAVTSNLSKDELAAAGLVRDRLAGAVANSLSAEEKVRQSEALTIRSIEARTVAEKAAIAAAQKRSELANQAIGTADRERRIAAASAAVVTQSTREAEDRLRGANDNAALAGLRPYERQVAQLEQRYREIFLADTGNLAKNRAAKAADRSAIDQEAMAGPLRDANRGLEEQAAALRVQAASLGASTEEATRLAAAQQLLNKYLAAGVPITAELRREIDAHAAAAGKQATAEEDYQRRRERIVGPLDDLRSGQRGLLTGVFSDLRQGRNVGQGITNQLGSTADRLFERLVSGPLTEELLGPDGKAGGGIFGTALAAILGGGKQSVGTATISAGTVIVTGSIGSASGITDLLAKAGIGAGAGSGRAGFDLTGGRASGDAAPLASGLNAFGLGGPALGGGSAAAVPGGQVPGRIFAFFRDKAFGEGASAEKANWIGAAMTGQAQAESGFRPTAENARGATGLFQHLDRAPALLRSIGGRGNLGDVDKQLDFAGRELSTSESRSWSMMMGAKDFRGVVRGATAFERPEGFSWNNPENTYDFAKRLRYGENALAKFSSNAPAAPAAPPVDASPVAAVAAPLQEVDAAAAASARSVTSLAGGLSDLPGPLGEFTQGLSRLGNSLASAFSGAFGGASPVPIPSNADGGLFFGRGTGRSDSNITRISHGEFIVNAASTSAHLPLLEAINENRLPAFAEGGRFGPVTARRGPAFAPSAPAPAAATAAPIVNHTIHNYGDAPVETRESRGPNGEINLDTVIRQVERGLAGRMSDQRGPLRGAVRSEAAGSAATRMG